MPGTVSVSTCLTADVASELLLSQMHGADSGRAFSDALAEHIPTRVSYWFDLDHGDVIDSLKKGNTLRFINHHPDRQNVAPRGEQIFPCPAPVLTSTASHVPRLELPHCHLYVSPSTELDEQR